MIFYDSSNHSTNIAENSFRLNFVPIYIFIPFTKTLLKHMLKTMLVLSIMEIVLMLPHKQQ